MTHSPAIGMEKPTSISSAVEVEEVSSVPRVLAATSTQLMPLPLVAVMRLSPTALQTLVLFRAVPTDLMPLVRATSVVGVTHASSTRMVKK